MTPINVGMIHTLLVLIAAILITSIADKVLEFIQ